MAQSSQRSQLLAIVDDLTVQLKHNRENTVSVDTLKAEQQAHFATKDLIDGKQKEIDQLFKEVKEQKNSLQILGQSQDGHNSVIGKFEGKVTDLNGVVEEQNMQIDDLIQRKSQLEQEVSRLKSQVELTQSSKDKIILKLKQEMRLLLTQQSVMNGSLNNTTALAGLNNISGNLGLNTSQYLASQAAVGSAANKNQINQFQSQLQQR